MYLTVKTSNRRVKYHDGCGGQQMAYIPAGIPYVRISNGTIGAGAQARNYTLEAVEDMIRKARKANTPLIIETVESDLFVADDIPF